MRDLIGALDDTWDGEQVTADLCAIWYTHSTKTMGIVSGDYTADQLRSLADWMDKKAGVIPKTCK